MIPPFANASTSEVLHALLVGSAPAIVVSALMVAGMIFLLGFFIGRNSAERPKDDLVRRGRVITMRVRDTGQQRKRK